MAAPTRALDSSRPASSHPASAALISRVSVDGYKSLKQFSFCPGRVTVLVGANGSGKSTILEAIALAAAAAAGRLDNESLALRGVRASHPAMLRSGLIPFDPSAPIELSVESGHITHSTRLQLEGEAYPRWVNTSEREILDRIWEMAGSVDKRLEDFLNRDGVQAVVRRAVGHVLPTLPDYLIYAPQIHTLRSLRADTYVEPLGVYGEGLFRLLRNLSRDEGYKREISEALEPIEWFDGYDTVEEAEIRHIRAGDLFVDPSFGQIDEVSANEGFLILLFYVCLMIAPATPRFFAIDNVDAGLNPKLARCAVSLICRLAKKHDKQVILTTHSPSALDGLDLTDSDQRLMVIRRSPSGAVVSNQVDLTKLPGGGGSVALSDAFLRGYLGGLPTGF